MNQNPKSAGNDSSADPAAPHNRPWNRNPWLVYVVPFAVYLLLTQLEPSPPESRPAAQANGSSTNAAQGTADRGGDQVDGDPIVDASPSAAEPAPAAEGSAESPPAETPAEEGWLGIRYEHYPLVYTLKIAITFGLMLAILPGYREVPFRVSWLAPLVGLVGAPIWIGLCRLETILLPSLGLEWLVGTSARTGFNPLEQLSENPALAYGFLAVRFFGLVVVVAVIEEFFLRGFLIRFFMDAAWWNVPFGVTTAFPLVVMTAAAMLSHPPSEYLAALVWFSLVSWLMIRTKNLWDCVIAHAVTNLLLGLYVVFTGSWELM